MLKDISFTVKPGETLAIVGGTGSGKSTLVNLLPRLHNPPPGTVFVDGTDVRDIPLGDLRGMIGFVPQEPFLFSDTLAANVAFGVPGIDREAPQRIAAAAVLSGFVSSEPRADDAALAERRPPVFWGRGALDMVIPEHAIATTAAFLPEHATLDERVYPDLAHSVSQAELVHLRRFLAGVVDALQR